MMRQWTEKATYMAALLSAGAYSEPPQIHLSSLHSPAAERRHFTGLFKTPLVLR